jgi:putative membrane protein
MSAPDVLLALCLLAYLRAAPRRWPARRTLSFAAGLGTIAVALQSRLAAEDDTLLSAHMTQHMLLLLVAPLLLLGARPTTLLLRALPRRAGKKLLRAARPLGNPYLCLAVYTLVLLGTHLPAFYDATLSHPLLHEAEHAAYVLAGLLLWTPLLDADPRAARRLGGLGCLAYLIAAMPAMALIGAYLNRATSVTYTAYAAHPHALADEQRAGAIMWVGGSVFLTIFGLWLAMARMSAQERRLRRREAAS